MISLFWLIIQFVIKALKIHYVYKRIIALMKIVNNVKLIQLNFKEFVWKIIVILIMDKEVFAKVVFI